MLGVKTIGNATMIAFDGAPILATDPWIDPSGVYFGSWTQSHAIPAAERDEILKSKYIWVSHGHPDHLDAKSIANLKNNTLLLPDHQGKRIYTDLVAEGFKVEIMPDRSWVQLSPHIKAMCICDFFQDAILLVDVGGRLFINLNDALDRGWGKLVRSIADGYRDKYLLKLSGYGDASMINCYDEDGQFIEPRASLKKTRGRTNRNLSEAVQLQSFYSIQLIPSLPTQR